MTEREKLIAGMEAILFNYQSNVCNQCGSEQSCKDLGYGECGIFQSMAVDLYEAGYRKLDIGNLIEPPCKIGDTAYTIYACDQRELVEFVVAEIRLKITDKECYWCILDENGFGGKVGRLSPTWYIGADKAYAEEMLKELEEYNNA